MQKNDVNSAMLFAIASHAGQVRKYTGDPYWKHPGEVAGIVATVPGVTEEMIMAAWLHDVVEDTDVSIDEIRSRFGDVVAEYVHGLSEPSTFRDGNRDKRKAIDRAFLAKQCAAVQTIKYADLYSNTSSILVHDQVFARRYFLEKLATMNVMEKGDEALRDLVYRQLHTIAKALCISSVEAYVWWQRQPSGRYEATNARGFKYP